MADNTALKEFYLADLAACESNGVPVWLKDIRRKGADAFAQCEFPTPHKKNWRFTDIAPILDRLFHAPVRPARLTAADIAPYLYGHETWVELVFVDGVYAPALSRRQGLPDTVCATGLAGAVVEAGDVIRHHLDAHIHERDAFSTLNTAHLRDGAFICIPPGTALEQGIHILYATTGAEAGAAYYPRNLVVAGRDSRVALVETHISINGPPERFTDAVTEIVLEENAEVQYGKWAADAGGYHIGALQVTQLRDSRFRSTIVTSAGSLVRNAVNLVFEGPGAECTLDGLYLNSGDQLVDNTLAVDHAVPNCMSRIAYKGILDGNSRAVYRGGVRVRQYADGSDSNQVNRTMLLSDTARVDTTPQLEIFADDVRCTHGATVGRPPEDALFYFRSRGIGERDAQRMLTCGFAREILDRIPMEPWRRRLEQIVDGRFASGEGGE